MAHFHPTQEWLETVKFTNSNNVTHSTFYNMIETKLIPISMLKATISQIVELRENQVSHYLDYSLPIEHFAMESVMTTNRLEEHLFLNLLSEFLSNIPIISNEPPKLPK